jgi:hypothetical protein
LKAVEQMRCDCSDHLLGQLCSGYCHCRRHRFLLSCLLHPHQLSSLSSSEDEDKVCSGDSFSFFACGVTVAGWSAAVRLLVVASRLPLIIFIPSLVQMMMDGRNSSGLLLISGCSVRPSSVIPKFPR